MFGVDGIPGFTGLFIWESVDLGPQAIFGDSDMEGVQYRGISLYKQS